MLKKNGIVSNILKKQVVSNALTEAQARAYYSKKTLSPSVDFMCMTKAYLNFKFSGGNHIKVDPNEVTYEGERAKTVGNNFHEFVQSQFKKAGVLKLEETTLSDENLKIKARLDMVVEIKGELYLVELKSAKSYSMHLMGQDGAPDIEHIKQLQMYFYLYNLNKDKPEISEICGGREITKGIILYESKNDHKIMEFEVNKDEEVIKDLVKYAKALWKNINAGKEPNYKFEPDSSECLYKCRPQFYEICHGKPKPVKELNDESKGVWGFPIAQETANEDSLS